MRDADTPPPPTSRENTFVAEIHGDVTDGDLLIATGLVVFHLDE